MHPSHKIYEYKTINLKTGRYEEKCEKCGLTNTPPEPPDPRWVTSTQWGLDNECRVSDEKYAATRKSQNKGRWGKQQMKSNAFGAGSVNLKGKKTMRFRCGCCTAVNFKEDELKKIHKKEMRNALVGQLVESAGSNSVQCEFESRQGHQ